MPRILLVEDDRDVRFMIEHALVAAGYEVDTAATMQDGIGMLYAHPHDLVIADAKLPDGTGMEVADRAIEDGVRAFIITGYGFTLPRETLKGYEILLKPLRPVEIIAAVERTLDA